MSVSSPLLSSLLSSFLLSPLLSSPPLLPSPLSFPLNIGLMSWCYHCCIGIVDRDWNQEFQRIVDELSQLRSQNFSSKIKDQKNPVAVSKKQLYHSLYCLAHDFVYAAKTFGKIIISEVNLPADYKTIKPSSVGGIAGGEKYMCHSIFFKFAMDPLISQEPPLFLYGGHKQNNYAAMKAASHELNGLIAYYNTKMQGIHYPLMALIDYRGYRLIAMTILPISKETLIYGSADAGNTIKANILPEFDMKMAEMGKILNLKPHMINGKELHTAGDIEGHLGTDEKYYLLDFSRVFPPEAPDESSPDTLRQIFYYHLRPELLMRFRIPLSSDAFSRWGKDNNQVHNREAREATQYLLNVVIPQFANRLDEKWQTSIEPKYDLVSEMHREGINIRHLGRLRSHCHVYFVRTRLLTEMVARVFKMKLFSSWRMKMERESLPLQVPYKRVVVKFMNLIVSGANLNNPDQQLEGFNACLELWTRKLKAAVAKKFPFSLSDEETVGKYDLRKIINHNILFARLQQLTGVKFSSRVLNALEKVTFLHGGIPIYFADSDVIRLSARVKHINIIDEAEANVLLYEALSSSFSTFAHSSSLISSSSFIFPSVSVSVSSPFSSSSSSSPSPTLPFHGPSFHLWDLVNKKFASSIGSCTYNHEVLMEWADALLHQSLSLSFIIHPDTDVQSLLYSALEKLERVRYIRQTLHIPLSGSLFLLHIRILAEQASHNLDIKWMKKCTLNRVFHEALQAYPQISDEILSLAHSGLAEVERKIRSSEEVFELESMMQTLNRVSLFLELILENECYSPEQTWPICYSAAFALYLLSICWSNKVNKKLSETDDNASDSNLRRNPRYSSTMAPLSGQFFIPLLFLIFPFLF